jgi:hypothetical protein
VTRSSEGAEATSRTSFGVEQLPDQPGFGALLLEHLLGDPIGLQHPLHQPLRGEHGLGSQEVAFALFGRQGLQHFLDQGAQDLFLFHGGDPRFGRDVGQQQFLQRIVIHQRGGQHALEAAPRALEKIQPPAQQPRFGGGIPDDVDDLLDGRGLRRGAVRTFNGGLDGRHAFHFDGLSGGM